MSEANGHVSYVEFLDGKAQIDAGDGFEADWLPDALFPFQRDLVTWAIRRGRAGVFADTGLGKSLMSLVWAQNVVRKTNGCVLILTPLAVGHQFVTEGEKFGIECARSRDGKPKADITVTNYEQLEKFDPAYFTGVVCDESAAIKSFDGVRRRLVTEFLRTMRYRLLCTATAAPNDYIELGSASEALGELGYMDMLGRFFTNKDKSSDPRGRYQRLAARNGQRAWDRQIWRFKGHAEDPFWRWVGSWARAIRRPSDYGYPNDGFILPPLEQREHLVEARVPRDGQLFDMPANGIREEREEQRRTIRERCELTTLLLADADTGVAWCQLNAEGDLLTRLIDGAVQVKGGQSTDEKEEALVAFSRGQIRILVSKPSVSGWGLNWQHCNRMTFFPTHSFEAHYQATRRCWRYGQKRPVIVDMVLTEGSSNAMANLARKQRQADLMFDALVGHMRDALTIRRTDRYEQTPEVPVWVR